MTNEQEPGLAVMDVTSIPQGDPERRVDEDHR
jgi:hypothetical protein